MSEELKPCPCPFCGSKNVITTPDRDQGYKWGYAECGCGARGPDVRTGYNCAEAAPWRADAIAAWNDRQPVAQVCDQAGGAV